MVCVVEWGELCARLVFDVRYVGDLHNLHFDC